MKYNFLIVGAGFYGLTCAQILAESGHNVTILEKRNHIAGNAYSEINYESGIEVHKYGSHIFHTSNKKIWDYCNRFTKFNSYNHTVWSQHSNNIYPMPINLATISMYFNKKMTPDQAKALISSSIKNFNSPKNLEEKAISLIGVPMYEAFIKGYTKKQWQVDPKDLPEEIITRLPVRYNFDNRYFDDTYQGLPINGYTSWAENMIDHPRIKIEFNSDFFDIKNSIEKDTKVIYTGPVDKYFNYIYGDLGWRTLDFEWEIHDVSDYQGTSVINYPDENYKYTRIHEFKHLHPEREFVKNKTIIAKEYSRKATMFDEPYYPINLKSDRDKIKLYRELSKKEENVLFGGRLGTYQYLDMHMAIGSAISKCKEILNG